MVNPSAMWAWPWRSGCWWPGCRPCGPVAGRAGAGSPPLVCGLGLVVLMPFTVTTAIWVGVIMIAAVALRHDASLLAGDTDLDRVADVMGIPMAAHRHG